MGLTAVRKTHLIVTELRQVGGTAGQPQSFRYFRGKGIGHVLRKHLVPPAIFLLQFRSIQTKILQHGRERLRQVFIADIVGHFVLI